jgi:hypothetical protein
MQRKGSLGYGQQKLMFQETPIFMWEWIVSISSFATLLARDDVSLAFPMQH